MTDQFETESAYRRQAMTVYAERRRRALHFSSYGDLFGEPAWDILLRLFIACRTEGVGLTDLACEIGFPLSSMSRWATRLEAHDLIRRIADDRDSRRIHLSLTTAGDAAMRAFFEKLRHD